MLPMRSTARVSPPPAMDEAPRTGNSTAVADLHIAWQFDEKAWRAEFVAGPFHGKTRVLRVTDLSKRMWNVLREREHVDGFLSHAGVGNLKTATKLFLEEWGKAVIGNEPQEFDALLDEIEKTTASVNEGAGANDTEGQNDEEWFEDDD